MGRSKKKKKSRKKAKLKKKRIKPQQSSKSAQSYSPILVGKRPPFPFQYVSSKIPCEGGDEPNHHLTCPFFDLDLFPAPDFLVMRNTRQNADFENVYCEVILTPQPPLEEERAQCAFTGTAPNGDKFWFRCLLPTQHSILKKSIIHFQTNPHKPFGPLLLRGTIVGIDKGGAQLGHLRMPDSPNTVGLQDVTLEDHSQTQNQTDTILPLKTAPGLLECLQSERYDPVSTPSDIGELFKQLSEEGQGEYILAEKGKNVIEAYLFVGPKLALEELTQWVFPDIFTQCKEHFGALPSRDLEIFIFDNQSKPGSKALWEVLSTRQRFLQTVHALCEHLSSVNALRLLASQTLVTVYACLLGRDLGIDFKRINYQELYEAIYLFIEEGSVPENLMGVLLLSR